MGSEMCIRDRAEGPDKVTPSDIVRMMVGREINDLYVHTRHRAGDVRLAVRDLTGPGGIGPVSFDVRAGEVVGMVGLIGAGRTEVARLVYGVDRRTGGTVTLDGEALQVANPIDGLRAGVGLLPESRKDQALFLDLTVKDNISMSTLSGFSSAGVIRGGPLLKAVRGVMEQLKVRANALDLESRALSGGNQQKLVLGRLLLQKPKVLILDEPTRGVDIGAKSEIYRLIDELARAGMGVVVISSEMAEIIGICDRTLVMREGRLVGEIANRDGRRITQEAIMALVSGVAA